MSETFWIYDVINGDSIEIEHKEYLYLVTFTQAARLRMGIELKWGLDVR